MVDSNLQREQITPSEKAYAYKMKYDAIKKKEQQEIIDAMEATQCTPSLSQAIRIKKLSEAGKLTESEAEGILGEIKQKEADRVVFKNEQLYRFFPPTYTSEPMRREILERNRKVKSMKKKIGLLVCMCLCLFCLTACGKKDQTDVDYNGYTYDQLKTACQNTVQQLEEMSDEDMQKYLASGDDITVGMVSGWQESRKDLGNFEGFGDCEVVKSGKTLTAAQTVNYEKRPLVLTYVFNYNSMEVTDVTVDQVYTTGEKMSKAGLNTLICIVTVFVVLIVICLVIYAFRIIPFLEKKFRKEKEVPADGAQKAVEQIEKMEEKKDDLELVAVIAAAIAAATGTSTDDFVVRSIKRRR